MKKFIQILSLIALGFLITACGKVPAGNVGVRVNLLGSEKGVDNEILGPGRYWIGWNQELYLFPTFTQNKTWEGEGENKAFSMQTIEGMEVGADIGISYNIKHDSVAAIFQKYRRGVDEITDIYLRNMIRDAIVTEASKVRVEAVYGEGKETLLANVEKRVRSQVDPIGINVERIYWIGQLRLPQEIVDKINAKVNADQITAQKVAELEQTKADAKKKIAEAEGEKQAAITRAEGEAKANEIVTQSINETLIKYRQIEKWDGVLPKVTSGATPLIQLN